MTQRINLVRSELLYKNEQPVLTESDINVRSKIWCEGPVLDKKERWEELCDLASKEQDPQKLLELIKEINCLLEAKLDRLRASKRSLLQ